MNQETIDKVLSRTATADEARQVAAWFATEEGQEYVHMRYDVEAYLLTDVLEEPTVEVNTSRMRMNWMTYLNHRIRSSRFKLVAAALIPIVILTGSLLFVSSRAGLFASEEYAEVYVPFGERLDIVLQDGTTVNLNSGTTFRYPKHFGLFRREVTLSGEAYFTVAKESSRPFLVKADRINVKVTGTKFNVKAYPDGNKIHVTLDEGSVNIIDQQQNIYPLKVHQNALYDKKDGTVSIWNVEDTTQHTAWLSKSLNFYRTPLHDILNVLQRQYEVSFDVKDSSLLLYRFSISTSRVNVDEVLRDFEKVSHIKFTSIGKDKYAVYSAK